MTIPGPSEQNDDPQVNALIVAVIGAFAPACYAPTWVPWLRWVGAACVVVVLVIVLHLAGVSTIPVAVG